MKIPAIILAGGKGTRFNFNNIEAEYKEKLLLPLGNKYVIEYVIDAVSNANNINRVIVAVSPFTQQTKSIIKEKRLPIELIDTPGKGYILDLKYVIKTLKLRITMTIVADIPLIRPEVLDDIIEKYFILNKPALSVMAEFKLFSQHGLRPTHILQSENSQKKLIPLGINIIDGQFIEQSEIEQVIYISDQVELLYNINTIGDYFQLIKFFNKNENYNKDV